jgi:hypothetical protein
MPDRPVGVRRVLVAAALLLGSACSSPARDTAGSAGSAVPPAPATEGSATAPSGTALAGALPLDQDLEREEFTPLIIATIGPDPIPVKGTDERFHVAYELTVLNDAPRPAVITEVQTLDGDAAGSPITTLSQEAVVARIMLTADYPSEVTPVTEIPPGRTAILILEDVYDTLEEVPAAVTHRIAARFGAVPSGQGEIANKYPDQVTQMGGPVVTSTVRPVVIGPPLTGDGWLANNGCCGLNAHRNVMVPLGGRINGGERFAVDWLRVDVSAGPPLVRDGDVATVEGDADDNESYLAFGAPVIAVADATVVAVVSDQPEAPPLTILPGLRLDQVTGNYVILDLGNSVYALYAHMKTDSAQVSVGDRVSKGEQIGELGNSGNTSEAHLHFQLMQSPLPFTSDQVPWVIDEFDFVGTASPDGFFEVPPPGPRSDVLPLQGSVCNFPADQ